MIAKRWQQQALREWRRVNEGRRAGGWPPTWLLVQVARRGDRIHVVNGELIRREARRKYYDFGVDRGGRIIPWAEL